MHRAPSILVVSHLYPSTANPYLGLFVSRQVQALRATHDVRVVAPTRWLPLTSSWKKERALPTSEVVDDTPVYRPRALHFPFGMTTAEALVLPVALRGPTRKLRRARDRPRPRALRRPRRMGGRTARRQASRSTDRQPLGKRRARARATTGCSTPVVAHTEASGPHHRPRASGPRSGYRARRRRSAELGLMGASPTTTRGRPEPRHGLHWRSLPTAESSSGSAISCPSSNRCSH